MSVPKLEALLFAIGSVKGCFVPESVAFQTMNPLLVQSFSMPGKNEIDDEGRRVFASFLSGVRACLFDLQLKCEGKSRAGLKSDDLLENLLRVYQVTEKLGQEQVVKFLRRALKDQSISRTTPLSWFVEN